MFWFVDEVLLLSLRFFKNFLVLLRDDGFFYKFCLVLRKDERDLLMILGLLSVLIDVFFL